VERKYDGIKYMVDSSKYFQIFIDMVKRGESNPHEFEKVLNKADGYYPTLVEYIRVLIQDHFSFHWSRSDKRIISVFAALLSTERMFNDVIKAFKSTGFVYGVDTEVDYFGFIPALEDGVDTKEAYTKMLDLHTVIVVHYE